MSNIILKQRKSNSSHSLPDSLHPLLARLYSQRGVNDLSDIEFSFKQLLSYESLSGLNDAVSLIYQAVKNDKNLLIVGDFDTDGATSTALMMRAFKGFGINNVNYLIPDRFDDGYGLSISVVNKAIRAKTDLIITVDNGISAREAVEYARQRHIEVIITDHHLVPEILPNAHAIINPQLPNCPFPSKNLAGVGVAFYVMMGLRAYLRENHWFEELGIAEFNLASLLDLVALGTVADVVKLDRNNRILVHQGIHRIRMKYCVAGIQALIELMNKNQAQLSSQDLAFYLAPKINAAGRMENMSIGVELLITDNLQLAYQIADELIHLNDERKSVERQMQSDALRYIETMNLESDSLPSSLVIYQPDFHQGVIGILSSRIRDKFYRPVISFAPADEGLIKGSGRSIPHIHLRNLLEVIQEKAPNLLISFGGHAMAAGLTIKESDLALFSSLFEETVKEHSTQQVFEHIVETDGELSEQYLNYDVAKLLKMSAPWGEGFPEPLFDGEFIVHQQSLVGEKHLKLILQPIYDNQSKSAGLVNAIKFNVDLKMWPDQSIQRIRAVYRLDPNEFRNNCSLSLLIEHIFVVE